MNQSQIKVLRERIDRADRSHQWAYRDKKRTERMIDGKGYALKLGEPFRFGCCDCGLTHEIVIVTDETEPGVFGIAVRQNKRATAARRRYIKEKP